MIIRIRTDEGDILGLNTIRCRRWTLTNDDHFTNDEMITVDMLKEGHATICEIISNGELILREDLVKPSNVKAGDTMRFRRGNLELFFYPKRKGARGNEQKVGTHGSEA